jgi:hypothetical protein
VEHESFLVKLFLRGGKVQPSFDSESVEVGGILLKHLLNDLPSPFQLINVP